MDKKVKIHLIGNAHIDPVWLWRWQEGFAEIKATFRSALDRMKEFPDFIFTCACAAYYKWVEENAPEMFEEIKKRVAEGRWVIVGGWWIQPDCNIPSGESFVRHGLYSQRYFYEKFGLMAKTGYNVDSFGHNGMLPQILKKSGMDYYVFMRPGDHEKELPGNLFWWESPDGSKVLAYKIPYSYGNWYRRGSDDPVRQKTLEIKKLAEKQGYDMMSFYGVGNHGGGPTIANIHTLLKMQAEEQAEEVYIFSSPNGYFEEIYEKKEKDHNLSNFPVVRDDLQHHASGCYSAYSNIKKLNRKAEHRLITAEKFAAIAYELFNHSCPNLSNFQSKIGSAWEKVLFNQFHDIMGGCSIKEAYEDAEEFYGQALAIGAEVLNATVQMISWNINTMGDTTFSLSKDKDWMLWEMEDRGTPLVVFNPLAWEVTVPVQVNKSVAGITDEEGNPLEIQRVRASQTNGKDKWDTLFIGRIPAMGYRVYWLYLDKSFNVQGTKCQDNQLVQDNQLDQTDQLNQDTRLNQYTQHTVTVKDDHILENAYLIVEFEQHTGYIKRIYDKINQVEVLSGCGAVPIVIDEFDSDTWAHGIFEFRNEIAKFSDARIQVIENGPIRARIRVINRYNASELQQDFILYSGRKELEVQVKLDWREKHKMLKLSFPVNVKEPKAVYEIPYGFIERPANGEEEPGQQWIDLSGKVCIDKENARKDTVLNKGYSYLHDNGRNHEDTLSTYGLAILNDCKYSFDVKENDLRMTIVRSPIFADHYGERDELCEYMDQGIQEFKYVLVPHLGDWRNSGIVKKAYELNVPIIMIKETYHKGNMPLKFEGIRVSAENIIASVFKRSEDGNGYVIRCYETAGKLTEAEIEVQFLNRRWKASFGGCEIKTFYIPKNQNEEVIEVNLLEMQ
ncbi:MAG TPA: alpha-mannosidase [Clostridiaceae bacterium]|nr:alpha-mannosidase [Clostridiaceae bacterium]